MERVVAEETMGTGIFDPWGELLRQSRLALTTLRASALEELAGRAECMLAATVGGEPVRQRIARPEFCGRPEVAREYRLLRDLLRASDRNLRVLRRGREKEWDDAGFGETRHPWGR
jgi:hypothetical protein